MRAGTFAKLSPPRPQRVLDRPRLARRVHAARRRPLVWVEGPPGAGKTTALATHACEGAVQCVWYQLDGEDADLATFFGYLAQAVLQVTARARGLPGWAPEYAPAAFARRFFRELVDRLRRPFLIVLDDYQELRPDAELHHVLAGALDELPRGCAIVALSRSDPPPAFARVRASDRMSIVGPSELAFTPEETAAVARLRGCSDPDAGARLHAATHGWAAGVVLLSDAAADVAAGVDATHAAFDYFAGEVLARADAATRAVLLETSLLPWTSGRAANELTGRADAADILERLARGGCFTYRHDAPLPTYQLHPLFREFLLGRARAELPRERRLELLLAGARLLRDEGRPDDAVPLLRDAGAWEELAAVVLAEAPALAAAGRSDVLDRWIGELPPGMRDRPWLLYWRGIARLARDVDEARALLEAAHGAFRAADDAVGEALAWCALVDCTLFSWGGVGPLDRWIEAHAAFRARHPALPSEELDDRMAAGWFTALIHRQPTHPELAAARARATAIAFAPDVDARLRAKTGYALFQWAYWIGDLPEARRLVDALDRVAGGGGGDPLIATCWLAVRGCYELTVGDPAKALATLERGLSVGDAAGVHAWDFMLHAQGALASLVLRDDEAAARALRRAADAAHPRQVMQSCFLEYVGTLAALARGDVAAARARHVTSAALADRGGMPIAHAYILAAGALVHLLAGDAGEARRAAARAEAVASELGGALFLLHAVLASACVEVVAGAPGAAVDAVARAVTTGSRAGVSGIPQVPGALLARVCAVALEEGLEVEWVRAVIRRNRLAPPDAGLAPEGWPWAIEVHTLRRFGVLREGEPLRFAGRTHRRTLELLQALVALGGKDVPEERLAGALWPGPERGRARHALETTLHRLRRLLGDDRAVIVRDQRVSLDPGRIWVDALALDRLVGQLTEAANGGAPGRAPDEVARLVRRVRALHVGPFLPGSRSPHVEAFRARLEARVGQALAAAERHERAALPRRAPPPEPTGDAAV